MPAGRIARGAFENSLVQLCLEAESTGVPAAAITAALRRQLSRQANKAQSAAISLEAATRMQALARARSAKNTVKVLLTAKKAQMSEEENKKAASILAAGIRGWAHRRRQNWELGQPRQRTYTFYERPIGLQLAMGPGGKTFVRAVVGTEAKAMDVPEGAEIISVAKLDVAGLGKEAIEAQIASAGLPLDICLDLTNTRSASLAFLTFPEGFIGLGLAFSVDRKVVVSSVARDCLAAERGVTVGSEILGIDSISTSGMPKAEVISRLLTAPRPLKMIVDISSATVNVVALTFPEGPTGLGLRFPKDGRTVVAGVREGSEGAAQGVCVGASVLDVNEKPLSGLGKATCIDIINNCTRPMQMRVDLTGGQVLSSTFFGSLDLSLTFPPSGDVLVSSVVDGGNASKLGVSVGSCLLGLNGVPVHGLGKKQVLELAKSLVDEDVDSPLETHWNIAGGSVFSARFEEGPMGLTLGFNTASGTVQVVDLPQGGAAILQGVTLGCHVVTVNDQAIRGLGKDAALDMISKMPRPLTILFDLDPSGKGMGLEWNGVARNPRPIPQSPAFSTRSEPATPQVHKSGSAFFASPIVGGLAAMDEEKAPESNVRSRSSSLLRGSSAKLGSAGSLLRGSSAKLGSAIRDMRTGSFTMSKRTSR